jgi:hypothetical protein
LENKRCNNCGEVKPISEFRKSKSCKDDHRGQCKTCLNETKKKWKKNNPEKNRESRRKHDKKNIKKHNEEYYKKMEGKTKICGQCKKELSTSEFSESPEKKDGFTWNCHKCRRENWKTNQEYNRKKHKESYEKNKEGINKQRKKVRREKSHRAFSLDSRARHRNEGYKINITIDELEILAKNTTNCPICSVKLDYSVGTKNNRAQKNSPSLDRINNEKILNKNNIWIICYNCNSTKRNRTMEEFIKYCTIVSNKFNQI